MARDLAAERQRLVEFGLRKRRGRVFAGVPVSGSELGWPQGTPVHRVDAVWIADAAGSGDVVEWSTDAEGEFISALARSDAVLISPRGYADRTAFGMLVAGRELLSRAFPGHQLLSAVALSDKLRWRSIAYLAEGIAVERANGDAPTPHGRRGPFQRSKPPVLSREDRLVDWYYKDVCSSHGTLWQEVPITDAALDGLYFKDRAGQFEWWVGHDRAELAAAVATYDAVVVEAKLAMNMDVIGQVIAGASALTHVYPEHRLVRQTVVVGGEPDRALEWVCHKRGIRVARSTASEVAGWA